MFRQIIGATALALIVAPAWAAPADDLLDALGVREVITLMQVEGRDYGDELADEMLPGGATADWPAMIERIYDAERMEATVRSGFVEALGDTDISDVLEFFQSDVGKRVIQLEISARKALIDDEIEQAARDAFRATDGTDDRDLDRIAGFVDANDLVEANVVGALNSSVAFYNGLVDGGAFEMTEDDILRDVWSQEEDTRVDTREWVFSFLMMAYGPLSDETVAEYVALSETDAGKAMNRALFVGFDGMYGDISYALGLALARQMQGQDL